MAESTGYSKDAARHRDRSRGRGKRHTIYSGHRTDPLFEFLIVLEESAGGRIAFGHHARRTRQHHSIVKISRTPPDVTSEKRLWVGKAAELPVHEGRYFETTSSGSSGGLRAALPCRSRTAA